jgi:gas vesicle protein
VAFCADGHNTSSARFENGLNGYRAAMGLKDELKKTIDNVGDAISELGHRGKAEAEQASREAAGDTMTPGEHVGSVLTEGKERVLAEVDRTKREVRENV